MTANEFDNIWRWLWSTRLRSLATGWLLFAVLVASMGGIGIGVDSSDDYSGDTKMCQTTDEWGHDQDRPAGWKIPGTNDVCEADAIVNRHADWDRAMAFAGWTMTVGLLGFVLPLLNGVALGTRGYSRTVRLTWTKSATKRALDERSRRLKAEALSDAAERETERLERELQSLMR